MKIIILNIFTLLFFISCGSGMNGLFEKQVVNPETGIIENVQIMDSIFQIHEWPKSYYIEVIGYNPNKIVPCNQILPSENVTYEELHVAIYNKASGKYNINFDPYEETKQYLHDKYIEVVCDSQ